LWPHLFLDDGLSIFFALPIDMSLLDFFMAMFASVQGWLFEQWIQPVLFRLGLNHLSEQAFDATELLLAGAIEIGFLVAFLGTLERFFPAERQDDMPSKRLDRLYTLLHRLGLFPLFAFALLTPVVDALESHLRMSGVSRLNLEQALSGLSNSPYWQSFFDQPLVSFFLYLLILDFADYWIHRAQHRFEPWWQLHALHHSQRQMNFWSDNRNHLLDDLIRDALMAALAMILGASPGQYVGLVVVSRMLQSLQHANLKWRFGSLGERVLVSPSFHRLHHGMGIGHEGKSKGCNFAVLFPLWDVIFRTADFRPGFVPTGIRDQLDGKSYGDHFWSQQSLALKQMLCSLSNLLPFSKKSSRHAS
jgi:sterol desaturase/sphingolipid hydroxylase (fatty acid hydroxylase superfamily)